MRRFRLSMAVAFAASLAIAPSAQAAPAPGCPAGPSRFAVFQIDPVAGDGLPAPGENAFWDQTVAAILAEGLTLADLVVEFGVATEEELYEGAMENLRVIDGNGDKMFCAKPLPEHQNGHPAYIFNVVDNNARVR